MQDEAVARVDKVHSRDVDREIVRAEYTRIPGTLTTFCVLVLTNGLEVAGVAHCANEADFIESVGKHAAYSDARDKVWPLLTMRLKDRQQT